MAESMRPVEAVSKGGDGYGVLFWAAAVWFALVVVAAVAGDLFPLPDPDRISPADKYLPVLSEGHLLGTDQLGRDILARLVDGSRISMIISFVTVIVGISVGGLLGTTVGYFGGKIEAAAMAVVKPRLTVLIEKRPAAVLCTLFLKRAGDTMPLPSCIICICSTAI